MNLESKHKKIILIIFIPILLIILGILTLLLLNNSQNIRDGSSEVVNENHDINSYPIMPSKTNYEYEFSYYPTSVKDSQQSDSSVTFNFTLPNGTEIEGETNQSVSFKNDRFELSINEMLEGFGGLYDYIPEYTKLYSDILGDFTRIKRDSLNEYFYTTSFKIDNECGTSKERLGYAELSCMDYEKIEIIHNTQKLGLSIICKPKIASEVSLCDDIVESMELNI